MAGEATLQLPDGRVVDVPPDRVESAMKDMPGARVMAPDEVTAFDQQQLARQETGGVAGAVAQFGARAAQALTPLGLFPIQENLEQLATTAVPVAKALAARFTGDKEEEARQQAQAQENLELTQQYQRARAEQNLIASGAGELAGLAMGLGGLKAATNMTAAASPLAAKAQQLVARSAGFNGLEAAAQAIQTSVGGGEAANLAQRTLGLLTRGAALGAGMQAGELSREETTSKEHLAGSYIASELVKGAVSGAAFESLLGAGGAAIKGLAGKYGAENVAKYGAGGLAGIGAYEVASHLGAGEPLSALVGGYAAYRGGKYAANVMRSFSEARQIAAAKEALDQTLKDDIAGEAMKPGAIPTPADVAAQRTTPESRKTFAESLLRRYEELEAQRPTSVDQIAALEAEKEAIRKQVTLTALEDDAATAAQQKFDAATIRNTLEAATNPTNPARQFMLQEYERLSKEAQQDIVEATKAVTETLKGQEVTGGEAFGPAKRLRFRELSNADGVAFEPAQNVAVEKLGQIEAKINELASTPGLSKDTRALWKNQQSAVRNTLEQIVALKGEEATAGDVMSIMDDWKRQGQRDIAAAVRSRGTYGADAAAFRGFRDLVDADARIWIENTAEFGPRATALQKELNEAATAAISNREQLAAALATKFDRSAYDPYRPGFEADSSKVAAALNRMSGAENASLRKLIETQNARELQLANVVKRHFDLKGAAAAKLDAQIAAHERLGGLFRRAADRSLMQETLEAANKATTAGLLAEAAGNLGVAANAAKAVAMMQSNVMRERAIARIATTVSERIDSAIQTLVKVRAKETSRVVAAEIARTVTGREKPARGTGGARPRVEGAATVARARAQKALESIATPKGTTQLTQAAKRAATVIALNQSPQLLQKAIMGSVGAHYDERNPTLYDATAVAAAKGFAYLQKNMPPGLKGMAQGNSREVPQVSDAELAAWNRRVQAVQDPLSVLEDIKSGAVTRDQAEALRVVHPAIYQSIHDSLIQAVANAKTPVPYAQRVMFFTLFDAPVDRTLDPGVVQLLQHNFAPRGGGAPAGGAVPRMPAGRTFTSRMRSGADMIGQR